MNEKPLRILLAAWVLALAACACPTPAPLSSAASPAPAAPALTQPGQHPVATDSCNQLNACKFQVTPIVSNGTCTLKIEPDALIVTQVKYATIEWRFADNVPLRFRFEWLRFKDEDPDYVKGYGSRIPVPSHDQFHDKHVTDRLVDVLDNNTVNGVWSFALSVTDGQVKCKVDPPIINDY